MTKLFTLPTKTIVLVPVNHNLVDTIWPEAERPALPNTTTYVWPEAYAGKFNRRLS